MIISNGDASQVQNGNKAKPLRPEYFDQAVPAFTHYYKMIRRFSKLRISSNRPRRVPSSLCATPTTFANSANVGILGNGDEGVDRRGISTSSRVKAWSLRDVTKPLSTLLRGEQPNATAEPSSKLESKPVAKSTSGRRKNTVHTVRASRRTLPTSRMQTFQSTTTSKSHSGSGRKPWKERLEEVEVEMAIPPPVKRLVRSLQPLHPRRKLRARVGGVPVVPGVEVLKEGNAEKAKVVSQPRIWSPQSRRTGLIALKKGMSVVWDDQGLRVPVTVLQVQDNQVLTNVLTPRGSNKAPYRAVQIGALNVSKDKTHIGMRGHFNKAGVPCKRFVKEFEVSEDAHLPPGMKLSAFHFVPGQHVDVQAVTMGKGFQGVMKRWGHSGGTASHGNSLAHRTPRTTGQHQDPGRVWPGKKMPGRMGGKWRTMQNLYVVRVDTDLNLIFVKGNVPGPDDGRTPVYISDAKKKVQSEGLRLLAKSGGEGDWMAIDATGKPLAPTKGKEPLSTKASNELGRGVTSLPFPAGSVAMAKRYAPVLVAPSTRVSSPWVGGDGA